MHTIKQIIENQKLYRRLILIRLTCDLAEAKKELKSINSEDEYIKKEVEKLKNMFKKNAHKKEVDKLFFIHPKRSIDFYAWWNVEDNEVNILCYDKK